MASPLSRVPTSIPHTKREQGAPPVAPGHPARSALTPTLPVRPGPGPRRTALGHPLRRAGMSPPNIALAIPPLPHTPRKRGVSPSPLGRSGGAGWFPSLQTGSRLPSFEFGTQPIQGPEAAVILIPRSCRGRTLFSPQLLFFAPQHFRLICRAVFCSLKRVLPLALGAWKC
ncbi:hypothetical protein NDU88_001085 [Pleurodeles waltl]|uniref:Uncharacterized protein n=1 Tax=Pleurodeles waltl TaxID=8319 RepID=A0AAV7SZ86_PLEWA|nr:hypothetical protein NDU88_001085 [Pleurodeles waltl]